MYEICLLKYLLKFISVLPPSENKINNIHLVFMLLGKLKPSLARSYNRITVNANNR